MPEAARRERYVFWSDAGALAAAAAISQAGENWLPFGLVAAAAVAGRILARRGRTLAVHWRTPLGLVALAAFGADFIYYTRDVILTVGHLMAMTSAIYLVSSTRLKERLWLLVQGLVLLAAAGAAVFEIWFVAYATGFSAAALMFAYRYLQDEAANGPWRVRVSAAPGRRLRGAGFAGASVLAMAALGSAFYVALPRFRPLGFVAPAGQALQPISGFASEVRLANGIGNILDNEAPVFRAILTSDGVPGEARVPLYWRGATLVYFTGDGWRKTTPGTDDWHRTIALSLPGRTRQRGPRARGPMEVSQEIMLEPLATESLFALPGLSRMDSDAVGAVAVDIENGDILKHPDYHASSPFVYTAVSMPAYPEEETLGGAGFDYDDGDRYMRLALDRERISPEIIALAQSVAGRLPTPYLRATAIADYLKANYEYSRTLVEPASGRTPVDDFLFRTRKGHCEYFASAMALMLRAVDVPSRVVNGFHGGEYNQIAGMYTVLQSDAHSWVEAYFPGRGWYTFDATPPDPNIRRIAGRSYLRGLVDYAVYNWLGRVVSFNVDAQREIYRRAQEYIAPVTRPPAQAYEYMMRLARRRGYRRQHRMGRMALAWGTMIAGAAATFFIAAAAAGWILAGARALARRLALTARGYPGFYLTFVRYLARRGIVRERGETARELAARAVEKGIAGGEAGEIVEAYYRVRFDGETLPPGETARLEAIVKTLGKAGAPWRG